MYIIILPLRCDGDICSSFKPIVVKSRQSLDPMVPPSESRKYSIHTVLNPGDFFQWEFRGSKVHASH